MIILNFENIKNLNTSLQVGDGVYAHSTNIQSGANDRQTNSDTGINQFVGVLRRIEKLNSNSYNLHVDNNKNNFPFSNTNPFEGKYYTPLAEDFIMFSKFSQGDSGVLGYYAKARFTNDSKEKAELFAVSSEVIINSN